MRECWNRLLRAFLPLFFVLIIILIQVVSFDQLLVSLMRIFCGAVYDIPALFVVLFNPCTLGHTKKVSA